MSTIVITGGAGFVGHHFVEHVLKNTDWRIVVFDKLTYASNGFDRLRDIEYPKSLTESLRKTVEWEIERLSCLK